MKKFIYLFLTVLIVACSSEDDSNATACLGQEELIEQYTNAVLDFTTNPTSTTCQAYISSIELLIQCAEGVSAAELEEYQDFLDNTDCSQF